MQVICSPVISNGDSRQVAEKVLVRQTTETNFQIFWIELNSALNSIALAKMGPQIFR
jgi:hypothetical protein